MKKRHGLRTEGPSYGEQKRQGESKNGFWSVLRRAAAQGARVVLEAMAEPDKNRIPAFERERLQGVLRQKIAKGAAEPIYGVFDRRMAPRGPFAPSAYADDDPPRGGSVERVKGAVESARGAVKQSGVGSRRVQAERPRSQALRSEESLRRQHWVRGASATPGDPEGMSEHDAASLRAHVRAAVEQGGAEGGTRPHPDSSVWPYRHAEVLNGLFGLHDLHIPDLLALAGIDLTGIHPESYRTLLRTLRGAVDRQLAQVDAFLEPRSGPAHPALIPLGITRNDGTRGPLCGLPEGWSTDGGRPQRAAAPPGVPSAAPPAPPSGSQE